MHTLSFKVSLRLFFPGVLPAILVVTAITVFVAVIVVPVVVILVIVCVSGICTAFAAVILACCIFLRLSLISAR